MTPSLAGFTFTPASYQVADVTGDMVLPPLTVGTGAFRRFLAEGVSNRFFRTTIALLNTTGVETTARLQFQTSTGRVVEHQVALAGVERATVDPAAVGWRARTSRP